MRDKKLIALWFFVFLVMCLGFVNQSIATDIPASANEWTWPLDGDFMVLRNAKYNTTIENTDYAVKNPDLVHDGAIIGDDHITCFDVGWHRSYHAGVDLYMRDGNTAGTQVTAISDGIVKYVDFGKDNLSVIIEHSNDGVWSVFWHLEDLEVSVGDNVASGQPIGKITQQDYTGRFPDKHPFGTDDSHLHFEIRTFYDGGAIFPNFPDCNTGYTPGVGYTYPLLPDAFGYLDPIEFLESRVTSPPLAPQSYLPVVHNNPPQCIEGQNLITFVTNSGFEYPVTNPDPWFEITTYFDPPDIRYYNFVQSDPFLAHSGSHYAFLGDQLPVGGWIVDEEMPQSFRLPDNIDSLEWVQYLWLEQTGGSPQNYGTDFGDQFILTLKDAETGQSLVGDVIIDYTSQNFPNFVWLEVMIPINNVGPLSNRLVSTSYSSLTDGDTTLSTMRVDDVSFITHCGN